MKQTSILRLWFLFVSIIVAIFAVSSLRSYAEDLPFNENETFMAGEADPYTEESQPEPIEESDAFVLDETDPQEEDGSGETEVESFEEESTEEYAEPEFIDPEEWLTDPSEFETIPTIPVYINESYATPTDVITLGQIETGVEMILMCIILCMASGVVYLIIRAVWPLFRAWW